MGTNKYFVVTVLTVLSIHPCHSAVGLLRDERGSVRMDEVIVSPNTCREQHKPCGITLFEVDRVRIGCSHAAGLESCLEFNGCGLKELEVWKEYVNQLCAAKANSGSWNFTSSMRVILLSLAAAIFVV